ADIVYILGLLDKLNYQLVTRPEIKGVEQLKGKKLGVSRFGSSADFGLRAVLKRLGIDPALYLFCSNLDLISSRGQNPNSSAAPP
ncbi:MAG TPA: hypothetical protein VI585_12180, partial [Candidatus Binatia bacterium]